VEAGVDVIDASVGGIGGCPFAPKATGNVATEDVVYLLEKGGYETGLDLDALISTAIWLEEVALKHPVASALAKAGGFPAKR
ncbi:MAG: hydroxymethylglutaryl-CoA lyase, partial [Oceanicaulis sp.]